MALPFLLPEMLTFSWKNFVLEKTLFLKKRLTGSSEWRRVGSVIDPDEFCRSARLLSPPVHLLL